VFLLALELSTSRLQVCRVIVRFALCDDNDEMHCGSDKDDDAFGATAPSVQEPPHF